PRRSAYSVAPRCAGGSRGSPRGTDAAIAGGGERPEQGRQGARGPAHARRQERRRSARSIARDAEIAHSSARGGAASLAGRAGTGAVGDQERWQSGSRSKLTTRSAPPTSSNSFRPFVTCPRAS